MSTPLEIYQAAEREKVKNVKDTSSLGRYGGVDYGGEHAFEQGYVWVDDQGWVWDPEAYFGDPVELVKWIQQRGDDRPHGPGVVNPVSVVNVSGDMNHNGVPDVLEKFLAKRKRRVRHRLYQANA